MIPQPFFGLVLQVLMLKAAAINISSTYSNGGDENYLKKNLLSSEPCAKPSEISKIELFPIRKRLHDGDFLTVFKCISVHIVKIGMKISHIHY